MRHSPETTGIYFNKIQCFCFDDERLDAHEKVDMPVVFFVDPALAADAETARVQQITLSCTFFRSTDSDKAKGSATQVLYAPTSRSSFRSVSRLITFGKGSFSGTSYMLSCLMKCTFQFRHLTAVSRSAT
jgi:hypothetical protein